MRVEIEKKIEVGDDTLELNLFDSARMEIYKLMERDNFARFKKSKSFTDVMDAVKPYTNTSDTFANVNHSLNLSLSEAVVDTLQVKKDAVEEAPKVNAKTKLIQKMKVGSVLHEGGDRDDKVLALMGSQIKITSN